MPRPCSFGPKGHSDLTSGCPFCSLYQAEERWRNYWDRPDTGEPQKGRRVEVITAAAEARGPCRNLGQPTGEKVVCSSCGGGVKLVVFGCSVFGACTIGKRHQDVKGCCAGCKSYSAAG